jgi:hypothetical protein
MFSRVMQIAPVAALLAIGLPQPNAKAMDVPSLQSDEAIVLVREDRHKGRGESRGHRSERRGDGDRDRGPRIHRESRDDGRDDRRFRRNRDGRDIWYGFGPTYDDCDWLRRRARATDDPYWWRRYRACVQRW